jgi:hypothetical protein
MREKIIVRSFIGIFFLMNLNQFSQAQPTEETVDIRRIWDRGNHNAFTDITFFKNKLYVVFREGDDHIPNEDNTGNGIIRILSSLDGEFWESEGKIELEGIDLRDPKISVTPRKRLMIIMGGSKYVQQELKSIHTFVSFSDANGNRFTDPEPVELDENFKSDFNWVWRVTWYEKTGYGVLYQSFVDGEKGKTKAYLVKTNNKGMEYELVTELDVGGNPSEGTVRFLGGGEMAILLRRDGGDKMGMLGTSKAPYTDWTWQKLDFRLGGPNMDIIPINKLLIATRVYSPDGNYTALLMGKKNEEFKEVFRLPSGGDNSYPGMFSIAGFVWLSYYSSHEGKTSVYYARIPFSKFQ